MEQNRGEDGRIDAMNLQHLLLSRDSDAFEKEGVDQLKQYLMKARESGIPIKFDGDRSGLHQVWFKGHKDLVSSFLLKLDHLLTRPRSRRSLVPWLVIVRMEVVENHPILPLLDVMDKTGNGVDVLIRTSINQAVVNDTCLKATPFVTATCLIAIARLLSVHLILTSCLMSCRALVPTTIKALMPI